MKLYKNDPRCFSIADRITLSQPQKLLLSGLQGSASNFVIAAVHAHPIVSQTNHVVILKDAEEAAYFHNTFENITDALDVFYFPSSFKNKKNYKLLNSSHVMLRTEALTRISAGGNKKMLITYPEALFEKVVLSKTLTKNIITIKQAEELNTTELYQKFIDAGFTRTDFVYEPGQFAVRGGILDVYSFGNEKPYRIELFGNDVDSIRIFDPESQLSERKLLQISIIPNIDTTFSSEEKVSLLEFLPDNTVLWLDDWEFIKERIITQEDDLEIAIEGEISEPLTKDFIEDNLHEKSKIDLNDFTNSENLERLIIQKHIIEIGRPYFLKKNKDLKNIIDFHVKPQPSFNRNFDLLIKDLKAYEENKYSLYIFAENAKQLERLHIIFTDLNANIQLNPVAVSIHEGFIDDDLKVVCYTDHQLFQRYHTYKVKQAFSKNKALTLKMLRELQPGDYVTHIDHGVGVYSGLQKIDANGRLQEAVRIQYKDGDLLYVNISSLHKISKYSGKEGSIPKMNKLGSDVWNKL
ncbi:MAG: CarD family transcriptional regulator, partial [Ferruginibacter sp.]